MLRETFQKSSFAKQNQGIFLYLASKETPDDPGIVGDGIQKNYGENFLWYLKACYAGNKAWIFLELFKRYLREHKNMTNFHEPTAIELFQDEPQVMFGPMAIPILVQQSVLSFMLYVNADFSYLYLVPRLTEKTILK